MSIKAVQKKINLTQYLYEAVRGKKPIEPDYEGYRSDIRIIEDMPLTADEHERLSRLSAYKRGI